MALTKREQILVERLKKSGHLIGREEVDAPFQVLIRPLATVGLDTGKFALWFEEEISTAIKEAELAIPVKHFIISPHVIDQTISTLPPDHVTFKRKENAVSVGLSIGYSTWLRSSEKSKLASMYENIKLSLLQIPQKHVGDAGREALLNIVENVYAKLQSRLTH